jgi:hypothetical protein
VEFLFAFGHSFFTKYLSLFHDCQTHTARPFSNHETFSSFYGHQQQHHRTQQATGPTGHYFFFIPSLINHGFGCANITNVARPASSAHGASPTRSESSDNARNDEEYGQNLF